MGWAGVTNFRLAGEEGGAAPGTRTEISFEGAESPADDLIDLGVGIVMIRLLGWHWELLPSFVAKLVPGVDLVPFWTLAVANVYRRTKRIAVASTPHREGTQS